MNCGMCRAYAIRVESNLRYQNVKITGVSGMPSHELSLHQYIYGGSICDQGRCTIRNAKEKDRLTMPRVPAGRHEHSDWLRPPKR